jgi:hypothetical protein
MSKSRDLYFAKHIQPVPTVDAYMKALLSSPYRTHRRMGIALGPELNKLIEEKNKKEESDAFARRLAI